MKTLRSSAKRCLALLLAIVLMVPAMSVFAFASEGEHIHSHADEPLTLGQLIVSNYGELINNSGEKPLTAAAKAILTSGALTGDVEYEFDSELGTGHVTLDAETKSVTAEVVTAAEYTWIPVSAGVYVDDVKVENVVLTNNGDTYTGTYAYEGNVFSVQVDYALTAEADKAAIAALLNIAADLETDLAYLDTLVADESISIDIGSLKSQRTALSVLNLLTDETVGSAMGLGEFGTIVGLLYAISQGDLSRTFELPFEFDGSNEYTLDISMNNAANTAAKNLYNQQVDNGGLLDLTKFFSDHSLLSSLEIVAEHNYELDKLLGYHEGRSGDGLYYDLYRIQNGLPIALSNVDDACYVLEDELQYAVLDWVNDELLPALEEAGVADLPESVSTLDELAGVITNLKAERLGVINMVNQQLTAMGIPAVSTGENAVADMEARKAQLSGPTAAVVAAALDKAINMVTAIDDAVNGLTQAMGINGMITELDKLWYVLDGMTTLFTDLYEQLADIVEYKGNEKVTAATEADYVSSWMSDAHFVDGTSSEVYSAINAALKAGDQELYEDSEIADTIVLATAADKANMNMSDMTVLVKLNVLDGSNDIVTSTVKKVITLPDGTDDAELLNEVNGVVSDALDVWETSGLYVEGKYQTDGPAGLPVGGLNGDCTVTVEYNPIDVTVTYVYGEAEVVPYGTTVGLPVHADTTKAWDYMVGGVHYVQGQSFKATEDVTVTREEGEAYTEIKVFPMVADRFDAYLDVIGATTNNDWAIKRIKNIIKSGALGVEDATIFVRYPKDGVTVVQADGDIDGTKYDVTAESRSAVYQSDIALWTPVSVTVYVTGGESFEVTDVTVTGDQYLFAVDTQGQELDHVQVNYELDLDAAKLLEKDDMKTTMNEIMEVYNDVVDQLDDLQTLANGLDNLKMVTRDILGSAKGFEISDTLYCTVCDEVVGEYAEECPYCHAVGSILNTGMAIDRILENNMTDNNLTLVAYMNNYLGDAGGLQYYYSEGVYEAMNYEVQSLKGPMKVLGKDATLLTKLEENVAGSSSKVQGVIDLILAMDLTGPDENLNNAGLKYLLSSLAPNGGSTNSKDTFEEVAYLEDGDALPGGELILNASLSQAAPNKIQVTVQVTIEDKTGSRVVHVTEPVTVAKDSNGAAVMDDDQIAAVLAAVKLLIPDKYTYDYIDDPKTQAVETAYSASALEAALRVNLTEDLMISYYCKEKHGENDHVWTTATCVEPSYCIYCKITRGTVDTSDSGHSWDEGVQTKDPTCVTTGLITYTCSACSATKTKLVAALDHQMSDYVSDNNVTCHSHGTKTATCARCDYFHTVTDLDTPLLAHKMGAWQKVNDATHTRSCQNTGCDYAETATHEWTEVGYLYEPTCTTTGMFTYVCSTCGATKDEEVPMLEHDYSGALVGDANGHRHLCVNGCGLPGGAYEAHEFPEIEHCDDKVSCECGYIKAAGEHVWGAWVPVDGGHQSSCTKCDAVTPVEPHAHEGVVTVPPTCVDPGVTTYTCPVCGDTFDVEDIPATGKHKYTAEVTAPTCDEQGYTTYTCSVCGDSYEADFVPATGHSYAAVVTPPTCTAGGYTTYTCPKCGDSYVDNFTPEVPHVFDDWYVYKKADCYGDGVMRRECINCDYYEEEPIVTTGHKYTAVVTPPTCEDDGYTTYTCSVCGHSYVDNWVPASHDFGDWYESREATCTQPGEQRRDCKNCDHFETRETPVADHEMGDWYYENESKKPTCTQPGEQRRDCKNCDHFETQSVDPTGHDWSTEWMYDGKYHWHSCNNGCGEVKDKAAHVYPDDMECGEADVPCDVCGRLTVEGEDSHAYQGVVTKQPSCTEKGEMTYTCSKCGDSYTEDIAPINHNYGSVVVTLPTCTEAGYTTYTCTNFDPNKGETCGHSYTVEGDPATDHSWDEGVVLPGDEPTCTKEGTKTYTCTNINPNTGEPCGCTRTEPVEMLPHDDEPNGVYNDDSHELECQVCHRVVTEAHIWVADPDDERNVAATANSEGLQIYNCKCGAEKEEVVPKLKPVVPGPDHEYTVGWDQNGVNGPSATLALPDNGGYSNYLLSYKIILPAYTSAENGFSVAPIELSVVVGNEVGDVRIVNLKEEVMKKAESMKKARNSGMLTDQQWTEYFYEAVYCGGQPSDEIQITCTLIDLSEDKLAVFVNSLNGENGALKFSLVEVSEGKYVIIANVANAASIQGAIMDVAMALVTGSYSDIGLKSHAAVNANGYEYLKSDGEISIQALINGILYQDGFGTGTIVDVFTSTGAINPDAVVKYDADAFLVGSSSDVGALLQTAYMSLGNAGVIDYEVDFLLTMSQGSSQLATIRDLLETVEPILSAETKGGKMQLTLKEKIYEIYQAEMMLTGVVDKKDPAIATNEDACKYLYDYLLVLMGDKVSASTYENTLDKLGQSYDLSKYESILNLIIGEFGNAQLSADCLSVNLSRNGKNTIDKLMNKLGVAVDPSLLGVIKEYGDPTLELSIDLTAAFEPAEIEFEAVIVDPYYGSLLDKADFATVGTAVSRINKLGGAAAVMLLGDITGDLTFNHTTILDLNGHTIDGSIVANDKLFIVDSSMDTAACGLVTGSVVAGANGSVYITGGKFGNTLSASFLKNGYVQNSSGVVVNELYTITEDEGDYTITLHSDFSTKPSKEMALALGIDLLTDMLLNGFDSAAMTITGDAEYEVYNITLNDLLALYAGTDRADQAISAVMEDVDFENIRLFVNDLLASVLDFDTISGNDGVVAEYMVTTNNWDIVLEHVEGEDYIELNVVANTDVDETATLTFVVDGEMAEALFAELGEIAEATATVDTLDVVYGSKTFDIGLAGNADMTLDLTIAEKHDSYVAVIAVVLAEAGNDELLKVLKENGNIDAQYAAFNNVSVKDVVSALKAIDANTDFADLAAKNGLSVDRAEMDVLNTAYQVMGYTAGTLLTRLDITGSSTQKMGALDADGNGSYVLSGTYANSLSRAAYGFTANVDGTATAKLTLKVFALCEHTGGTATCMTQAKCDLCGELYGELDPNNHKYAAAYEHDNDYHWHVCEYGCGATTVKEAHENVLRKNTAQHWYECSECGLVTVGKEDHYDNDRDGRCDNTDCGQSLHTHTYVWYDNQDDLTHTGLCSCGLTAIGYHSFGYDNICILCGYEKVGHCPSCSDDICHTEEFQDLNPDHWYHEYTDYVICKGIMLGISSTEKIFDPTGITTRAMLVTTLYRDYLARGGAPVESTAKLPFSDVVKGAWYTDAVIWAAENGIVLGYGNGKFGPGDTLTREQSATIFYRYAKFAGFDSSFNEGSINTYPDYAAVSNWAEDGVKWAVTQNMMNGRGSVNNATLSPDSDLQRAEIAALLYRWFVLFVDGE